MAMIGKVVAVVVARLVRWLPEVLLGAGVGLILAAGTPAVAFAQSSEPPASEVETDVGDLSVAFHDSSRMVGSFGLAGSVVSYDARRTGPDQAALTLVVNGKTLEASFDFAAGTGTWTGHGAILGPDGKTAMLGMEKALAGAVQPRLAPAPHEELLYRAVLLWSDAPAGLLLTGDAISLTDVRTEERTLPRPGVSSGQSDEQEMCLDPLTGSTSPAACQQSNENGVAYIRSSVCGGGTALECHDANGHCFRCATVNVGQPYNCRGRCGGGCCTPAGVGLYTYDCLDHDKCCGDHGGCFNPWDGECGDEYFEADDDFFASPNCDWAC